MRALVLALVACSSSGSSMPPESSYEFPFRVFLLGTFDTIPGAAYEYDYRFDGECLGRGVAGTPFTPRRYHGADSGSAEDNGTPSMLAPSSDVAVGVIVRSGGRELARGCIHVPLAKDRVTSVTVELR